jgi:3'(2'), 5'-bisphosphate nucleotidase
MNSFLEQFQKLSLLIRDCGQQAQQLANQPFQVYEKGINDYVTSVDRALDQQLTAGLNYLFPDDGVITEESMASWQAFSQNHHRLWFVDPLDGTDDFIQGKPHYSVMVGLMRGYEPIAGWIYAPVFDTLYYGGKDFGLFHSRNEDLPLPLVPTSPNPPSDQSCPILLGCKDQRRYGAAIAERIPGVQFNSIGSFGLKVLQVIRGQAGLYAYLNGRVKLWDTTGPLALAQAAGLICCDLAGEPIQFAPEAVDPQTLVHHQPILVGWKSYVDALRSPLQQAVAAVPQS